MIPRLQGWRVRRAGKPGPGVGPLRPVAPRYPGQVDFIVGVALFALGIAVTIALHEWGHMTAARMFGMRVRRYFIGFGPTLVSWRRRHAAAGGHRTEYGIKAIPLGGFCDIAGMTAQDPVTPDEEPWAMYRRPWWQRVIVLAGGVFVNLILGVVLLYVVAMAWGLPDMDVDETPRVASVSCVPATQNPDGTLPECTGEGPAQRAGILPGDVIRSVNGEETETFADVTSAVRDSGAGPVTLGVERDGRAMTVEVTPDMVDRRANSGALAPMPVVGMTFQVPEYRTVQYGPLEAVPATFRYTGEVLGAVWDGLLSIPEKVPGVVASVFGAERDPESPMSVVGASRAGGELAERDLWNVFVMMLANLNFFLAFFNLVPLPPLDGGHIVVVLYEKVRDLLRRARGLQPGPPADYAKLMPVTMAFTAVLLIFGGLVIAADVVNPIRLFG